jgi:hypothetical protein
VGIEKACGEIRSEKHPRSKNQGEEEIYLILPSIYKRGSGKNLIL